jgi:hypothetical protein
VVALTNAVANYSSTMLPTTLTASVNDVATVISVVSVAGAPSTPFRVVLEPGTANEEICTVSNVSGLDLTISRGDEGTSAVAHVSGSEVRHMLTGLDLQTYMDHVQATASVHGTTGTLVTTAETQTLTNKTLSGGTVTGATITGGTANPNSCSVSGVPVVTTTATQTMTGKTLTAPTIAGGTIDATTLTVDSDPVISEAAAQTMTGKTVQSATAGDEALIVKGSASQTANFVEFKTSADTLKSYFDRYCQLYHPTGPLPYAFSAGKVTLTFSGTESTSSTVTFPTDRFSATPAVTMAVEYNGRQFAAPRITSISSTAMDIVLYTHDGTTFSGYLAVHWQAVQMLPGSTAG